MRAVLGVLYAFEFARRCDPLRRFLLVSSDATLSAPTLGGPVHSRPATPAVQSYALSKLAAESPQKAELVKLRYFAGMTVPEAAEAMNISRATASRHWSYAKVFLYCEMEDLRKS